VLSIYDVSRLFENAKLLYVQIDIAPMRVY
jgi:hypothetical protein